jgi:putative transposase
MVRRPRFVLPGTPLHLIQRGNNRSPVLLATNELCTYRALLHAASLDAGCAIHAYVFMTNHVHLLVTPPDTGAAARFMKGLSQGYARWFNRHHRRTGTLWEGRYRSSVIDSERYLLVCSRYIELNPVRAGMVARPEDYPWSSFHGNAAGREDALLSPHPCYTALGGSPAERQAAYRALLAEELDPGHLDALRRATHTRTVFGPASVVASLEESLQRQLPPMTQGGDRRSAAFRRGRC